MAESKCPRCGNTGELLKIDGGLKQRLRSTGGVANPPDTACANCYREMTSQISQGAQLRARQMARDQQRMIMWRNRVNLIKQAKAKMAQRSFSEAAALYEKYIRILEVIYDAKPGELKTEFFANKAREQELTVIASVYWDLVRIYDSSPMYGDRQQKSAAKLIEFGKMIGSAMNKIVKQAEEFQTTARNPKVIKGIIKNSNRKRSRCFIATAAFETPDSPEIRILTAFRDEVLEETWLGRGFVKCYYVFSPPVARFMDRHVWMKPPTRKILNLLAKGLSRRFKLGREDSQKIL